MLTPTGASSHHWSRRTQQHTVRILRGVDPLAREPGYARLLYIGATGEWHIVDPDVANETAGRAALQALMARWNVRSIGATAWNFSIEAGGSIGPPAAWEENSESAAARSTGRRGRISITPPASVLQ